jgi:hypothetical protein
VHEEAVVVGALDQVGWREQGPLGVGPSPSGADDVALPGPDPVGVGAYLLERRNLEPAIEALRAFRECLNRAEGLDLGQREVRREPPGLLDAVDDGRTPPVRELGAASDIGGVR